MTTPLSLLIAGRDATAPGLYSAHRDADGVWVVDRLDTVDDLAALAAHPTLPIVYGTSGVPDGELVAWRIGDGRASRIASRPNGSEIACHLAVSPDGAHLVLTDFGGDVRGGGLVVWDLCADGVPLGTGVRISSRSHDASAAPAHPHQAVFVGGIMLVPDLGADVIRTFSLRDGAFAETGTAPVPTGTGPRHLVVLGDGVEAGVAVSGELSETVLIGSASQSDARPTADWTVVESTGRRGDARTRSIRNYPGDIARHPARGIIYLANRGHDTVLCVDTATGRALVELDAAVAWPQHLFVTADELVVAGWDSGCVAHANLDDGVPQEFVIAFRCPGAAWIIQNPEAGFAYTN